MGQSSPGSRGQILILSSWVEMGNVGCINNEDGYFHKVVSGAVYGLRNTILTIYNGSYKAARILFSSSGLSLEWDQYIYVDAGSPLPTARELYLLLLQNLFTYHGCDEWRAKTSERTAIYC